LGRRHRCGGMWGGTVSKDWIQVQTPYHLPHINPYTGWWQYRRESKTHKTASGFSKDRLGVLRRLPRGSRKTVSGFSEETRLGVLRRSPRGSQKIASGFSEGRLGVLRRNSPRGSQKVASGFSGSRLGVLRRSPRGSQKVASGFSEETRIGVLRRSPLGSQEVASGFSEETRLGSTAVSRFRPARTLRHPPPDVPPMDYHADAILRRCCFWNVQTRLFVQSGVARGTRIRPLYLVFLDIGVRFASGLANQAYLDPYI
jgi:hypothetical protein